MPIRVLLISNFRLILNALAEQIAKWPKDYLLVGTADSFENGIEQNSLSGADVIVVDIDTAPDNALPFITTLHAISEAKILLLTRLENNELQDKAIVFGARGVVDRNATPENFLTAIKRVHEGQVWLDRIATGRIFVELSRIGNNKSIDPVSARMSQLTEREQSIVTFIARNSGSPGKVVAQKLNISESTLRNHLTSIYEKLGVANRHGLLAYAFQNGLAERPN